MITLMMISLLVMMKRMMAMAIISDNGDDANDEDLRNVAQKSHHVAEQVGLLREPLFTLRSELLKSGAGLEEHTLRKKMMIGT